jgi:hypothetical protein
MSQQASSCAASARSMASRAMPVSRSGVSASKMSAHVSRMIIGGAPRLPQGRLDVPDVGAGAERFERDPSFCAAIRGRDQARHHGAVIDHGDLFPDAHALQPSREVLPKLSDLDLRGRRHRHEKS